MFDSGLSTAGFCSRNFFRAVFADDACVLQNGQKFHPACSGLLHFLQPEFNSWPQCGQPMNSTATAAPHPLQSLRISLTSVTTRSSSSAVVTPALTLAS